MASEMEALLARDRAARESAVDPARNVVLEASAGTGKTHVLVTRYINLLRAGVDPANILAITFTRKAAAEMRERILRDLRALAGESAEDEARWASLRDRLADISISTIDAFCFALLREFPLEADLDPGFDIADETAMPRLTDEAIDGALGAARRLASTEDVGLLMAMVGERRVRRGLEALIDRRLSAGPTIRRFLTEAVGPSPSEALARLVARMQGVIASFDGGLDAFISDGPAGSDAYDLVAADLRAVAAGFEFDTAGAGHQPGGSHIARAVVDRVSRYFVNDDGTPRVKLARRFLKRHCRDAAGYARHVGAMAAAAPQIADATAEFERHLNVALVRAMSRLFRIARRLYLRALDAQASVDFTEGLSRTLRLLRQMDEFARSRYRLEARYHHVLVDEFQDTNPSQWRLVAQLIAAWGEGIGLAHGGPLQPSIFIVGDRKQSIYAFRDADVRMLARAHRHVLTLRPDGRVRRSIARSFRAAPELLAFTNDLFSSVDTAAPRADAFRFAARDRFPVETPEEASEAPPQTADARFASPRCFWTTPSASSSTSSRGEREAENVRHSIRPGPWKMSSGRLNLVVAPNATAAAAATAAAVARLLADGEVRDRQTGLPRRVRPGDIAILFRSRSSHREIESALESRAIPTYVYKGLGFFDADEVKDLVALLRYLAQPSSPLCAAALLRTRFVRVSDRGVRLIASRAEAVLSGAEPLPEGLSAEDRGVLDRLRVSLAEWLLLVDRVPPSELLDRIVADAAYAFELRGARFAQARENLKKIRAMARRLQNRGYATMARVAEHLARLSAGDESNAVVDALDSVNLMTVHAAKGLEFPIVFVTNLDRGTGGHGDPVVIVPAGAGGRQLVSVAGSLPEADEAVRDRDREETKRLLYVAVTRARERLYLGAVLKDGRFQARPGSLGEVLPASLKDAFTRAATGGGSVEWRPENGSVRLIGVAQPDADGSPAAATDRGDTAAAPAPLIVDVDPLTDTVGDRHVGAAAYARSLTPGFAGEPGVPADEPAGVNPAMVGTIVHRLFQVSRHDASSDAGWLAERARAFVTGRDDTVGADSGEVAAAAVEAFLRIRRRTGVASLVDDAACEYELPFSLRLAAPGGGGTTGPPVVVRGSIDCLARRPDGTITVIELKTGRRRDWHQHQLDLYVRAARCLFPGLAVEGRLVYLDDGESPAEEN